MFCLFLSDRFTQVLLYSNNHAGVSSWAIDCVNNGLGIHVRRYTWCVGAANTVASSNQPTSVAPQSGATQELVALRLERLCSVLFMPIHLQIQMSQCVRFPTNMAF